MRSRLISGAALLLGLSIAGSVSAGTQRFYYDPLGRLLGETQTAGELRTSQSDLADNISYLHVQPLISPTSVNVLNPTQSLVSDQNLSSTDGHYGLSVQGDGNLVLYNNSNGTATAIWASNTSGHQAGYLAMQGDGNLVFYGPDDSVIWASGTAGNPGAGVIMQPDGNLVIYSPSGKGLWSTGTSGR